MEKHHDLYHEFPNLHDKIQDLKLNDGHFKKMFDEYHQLDHKIHGLESTEVYTDDELKNLRTKRAHLKDRLFEILQS